MIALTLLLTAQYVLDPEPIMQIEDQNDFNRYPSYDYQHSTTEMLGVPNGNTGEVESDAWFIPGSWGFTVDFSAKGVRCSDAFAGEWAPEDPVLVIEEKGHLYFLLTDAQIPYFLTRWIACKACYRPTDLAGDFKARLSEPLKRARERGWVTDQALYTTRIEKIDVWPSVPSYAEVARHLKPGSRALYLQPWMLRFVRIHIPPKNPSPDVGKLIVPYEVAELLGFNPVWIRKAYAKLGGLTWKQYHQIHGNIPGARSSGDIQYTFELRPTIPFDEYKRRITWGTRCEPEVGPRGFGPGGRFTECAERLWNEERDADRREVDEMTQLCDVYAN